MLTRQALIALPLIVVAGVASAESLDVLADEMAPGVPKTQMMNVWLKKHAFEALDRRVAAFQQLKTPGDIAKWQRERRDFFLRQLGGFPERTPLNPQITGKRTFDDYRIEKVIFEPQPGFHVTATLYLPLGAGPHRDRPGRCARVACGGSGAAVVWPGLPSRNDPLLVARRRDARCRQTASQPGLWRLATLRFAGSCRVAAGEEGDDRESCRTG